MIRNILLDYSDSTILNRNVLISHLDQQHSHRLICKHLSVVLVTGECRTVVILIHKSYSDLHHCDIVGWICLSCFDLLINKRTECKFKMKICICISVACL